MILEALHTTINPILSAHPLIGDIEAELPFCLYKADAEVIRDKTGIIGYSYLVDVGIVATDIGTVNTHTQTITAAIVAMSGTINSTIIEAVIHTNESGVYFATADQVYINDLEFKIFTKNR
jgi:hypothetical protein